MSLYDGSMGGAGGGGGHGFDSLASKLEYTLPGVIHFLQQEWKRFEHERNEWSVERAMLQSRIVVLEGERRGLENLKNDLLRRIKMLEFALRQERSKFYTPPTQEDNKAAAAAAGAEPAGALAVPAPGAIVPAPGAIVPEKKASPALLSSPKPQSITTSRGTRSKMILQKYLEEMGHTEELLFESLKRMGAAGNAGDIGSAASVEAFREQRMANYIEQMRYYNSSQSGAGSLSSSRAPSEVGREDYGASRGNSINSLDPYAEDVNSPVPVDDASVSRSDTIKLVGKPAAPLAVKAATPVPTSPLSSSLVVAAEKAAKSASEETVKAGSASESPAAGAAADAAAAGDKTEEEVDEAEQEAALAFKLSSGRMKSMMKGWDQPKKKEKSKKSGAKEGGADEASTVSATAAAASAAATAKPKEQLDELAALTFKFDDEPEGSTKSATGDSVDEKLPPKQWKLRTTLRSHYDVVRGVAFTEDDLLMVSGSEDGTLKLWNIDSALNPKAGATKSKKDTPPDPEPIHTYRGHKGAILSLAVGGNSQTIGDGFVPFFSGGVDHDLRIWSVVADTELYAPYADSFSATVLKGHTDCIWDIRVHPVRNLVATAGADSTWRLWSFGEENALKLSINGSEGASPTSIDFVATDLKSLIAAYTDSSLATFDLEYGKEITKFESASTYDGTSRTQINKVITHPTLSLAITAHEDKYLRFFDTKTGKCIHSMIAHRDAVSCLAVNPSGLYVMSGGHDSSVRGWDIHNYNCIQEFSSHRKKYDEAVHSLSFHTSSPLLATGGTDATIKIYSS